MVELVDLHLEVQSGLPCSPDVVLQWTDDLEEALKAPSDDAAVANALAEACEGKSAELREKSGSF